jgi:hypothetical protein
MAFDEYKYRILVGLFDMAGQLVSSQITKPDDEEHERVQHEYYEEAKAVIRKDNEKRIREEKKAKVEVVEPVESERDLTPEKIHEGVACLPCVPPDTYIVANPNSKQIQDLNIGDKVLDQSGKWTQIQTIYDVPYKGIIYDIFVKYQNTPLTVTPEHPILVTRVSPCPFYQGYCTPGKHTKLCEHCTVKYFNQYTPKFMKTTELFETEWKSNYTEDKIFLMTPRITEINDIDFIELKDYTNNTFVIKDEYIRRKITRQYNQGKKTIKHQQRVGKPIKNYIKVDSNFMKLVGFYLAEGR